MAIPQKPPTDTAGRTSPCPEPRVTVRPAIGARWIGTEVGVEVLTDYERDHVKVPGDYALVRCWRPGKAHVHKDSIYLVLRRFIASD